jgi:hypothetical protein
VHSTGDPPLSWSVPPPVRPSRAVALALILVLGAAGCGAAEEPAADAPAAPSTDAAPAPAAPPAPDPATAPEAVVEATRTALLDAARAGDWDAIAALLPADGRFTASFGAEDDPIAYYRSLPRDPLPDLVTILEAPGAELEGLFVWPDLHARVPFTVDEAERTELDARYGADFVAAWEQQGSYTGWRVGIAADGTWRFFVAGD